MGFFKVRKCWLQLSTVLSLFLGTRVSGDEIPSAHRKETPPAIQTWAGISMDGCVLDWKDKTYVRWLLFHRDGGVSVTLGKRGGGVAAPLLSWKIEGPWLQILEGDNLIFQMKPIKVRRNEITVDNGRGQTEVYTVKRVKLEERSTPGKKK